MIDPSALELELRAALEGEVRFDSTSRLLYATDASLYRVLFDHSAGKPDAVEDHPWGHTAFKIRSKIFVILSGPESGQMTVKAHPDEIEALLSLPYIQRAPYVGRYGWVRVVPSEETLEHALELVDTSYELIGPKKRAKK